MALLLLCVLVINILDEIDWMCPALNKVSSMRTADANWSAEFRILRANSIEQSASANSHVRYH